MMCEDKDKGNGLNNSKMLPTSWLVSDLDSLKIKR